MSRCRACNIELSEGDLLRKAKDWDYCSECRNQSTKKYHASDKEYDHQTLTNIQFDGSPLSVELGHTAD